MEDRENIHWTTHLETLFKKTAEQCSCLRWTHDRAHRYCLNYNTYLTLPVIVLSGFSGIAATSGDALLPFEGNMTFVGLVSFFTGILQTISSYFGFSRRAAEHRICGLAFEKIVRIITFELSLPRKERMTPNKLILLVTDELNRLAEVSPFLPDAVIQEFKKKFHSESAVSIPDILNGISPVNVVSNETCETPAPRPNVKITVV